MRGALGAWVMRALAACGAVVVVVLAYPSLRGVLLEIEETPAARGLRLAERLGCFACHGPGGAGGIANPGSQEGEVPAFVEQTQMMYVTGTDELREYVLDGMPKRRRDEPEYVAQMQQAALHMPAYRPFVTASEVEDLVAYLRATSGQILPKGDPLAFRGAELAIEYECFACHGPLGAGGVANPGSFKGYVPGFWASDFDDLVRDDAELREWLADGKIDRIAEHPIGGWFFRRQALKMPAYGEILSAEQLDALATYVRWIRKGEWRGELE
jgi:mono/diheme cytochrome c family protein